MIYYKYKDNIFIKDECLSLLDTRLIKGRVQIFVVTRYTTNKRSGSDDYKPYFD